MVFSVMQLARCPARLIEKQRPDEALDGDLGGEVPTSSVRRLL
jgi:hypothetical protein